MLKNELLVESIGEPNVVALSEIEQGVFLQTLFERISKLNTNK